MPVHGRVVLPYLALAILALLAPRAAAQSIQFEWSKRFGGTSADQGRGLAVDTQGNIFVIGEFEGTIVIDFQTLTSAGENDVFLAKFSPLGVLIWAARYGSTGRDVGFSVATDAADNVYAVGTFEVAINFGGSVHTSLGGHDMFVASFQSNGIYRWSRSYGGASDEVLLDVATHAANNLTIAGTHSSVIDIGGGPLPGDGCGSSALVAHLDYDGNHLWSWSRLGRCNGPVFIAYSANAVGLSSTAEVYAAVNYHAESFGQVSEEGYLQKFDADGDSLWIRGFVPGLNPDEVTDVAVDVNDGVYVWGNDRLCVDNDDLVYCAPMLAKYDPSGTRLWTRRYPTANRNNGSYSVGSVAADLAGNVAAVGGFYADIDFGNGPLVSAGSRDCFVVSLSPDGLNPSSARFGGTGFDNPEDIVATGTGYLVLASFNGTTNVDGTPHTSAGNYDVLLVKLRAPNFVAVAIEHFRAFAHDGVVSIESRFRSDLGVETVNIYRGSNDEDLIRIASVPGDGTGRFTFDDRTALPGETYRYQIGVVDGDGEFYSEIATVAVSELGFELSQNRPNPFNPGTTIQFVLPERGHTTIAVYDVNGRLVRRLLDETRSHGTHEISWDGRDDGGEPVASGVYFYRLTTGKTSESRKMILLK